MNPTRRWRPALTGPPGDTFASVEEMDARLRIARARRIEIEADRAGLDAHRQAAVPPVEE